MFTDDHVSMASKTSSVAKSQGLSNVAYPLQGHLKTKSREISFVRGLFRSVTAAPMQNCKMIGKQNRLL